MEENTKKVLEIMQNAQKPLKTAEIAELSGIDAKEISKIIDKLKKEDKIDSPKRCFYCLKK